MGAFNRNALVVSGSSVGIGVQNNGAIYRLVSSGDTLFSGGTMTVRGRGTTSSTTSLLVQNGSSNNTLQVLDDASVIINGNNTSTTTLFRTNNSSGNFTIKSLNNYRTDFGYFGNNTVTILDTDISSAFRAGLTSISSSWYAAYFTCATGDVRVGQNTTGTNSNPSAILQINTTSQGFLQPRMTTVQKVAISTPATGLTVYDTTLNTNEYYDGAAWRSIASQAWVQSQGYLTGFTEGDTLQIVSDRGRVTTSLSSTGTTLVASATTGYTGVFFNYTLGDGTSYRAGTVTSVVSSGSTVEFTETSTNDIGNTSPVSLSVGVGGGFINLSATTTTTGWTIKVVPQGI
jgi:hypothetical protein